MVSGTPRRTALRPYRTRMIVRTPPATDFSGVVFVEWFNVTAGTDSSVDWGYVSEELARSGHAYVGVSVQAVGVDGVESDRLQEGLVDTRGLVVRDPERYGTLDHPGDAYAFDIFTQAGAAVAASGIRGRRRPRRADPDPRDRHRRVAVGHLPDHLRQRRASAGRALRRLPDPQPWRRRAVARRRTATPPRDLAVRIRTDLAEPVFMFQVETDVNVFGYARARQDDTDTVATWEVAGASHSDAWSLGISGGIEPDASLGVFIGCQNPINDGPHHETLQAAIGHLGGVGGRRHGPPPVAAYRGRRPRWRCATRELTVVRDELGIAVGGVRTPPVDAPIRVLSGDPSGEEEGFCFLFGQTLPIEPAALVERYGDLAGYETALRASADASVEAGWLIREDADDIIAEELARAAELGLG